MGRWWESNDTTLVVRFILCSSVASPSFPVSLFPECNPFLANSPDSATSVHCASARVATPIQRCCSAPEPETLAGASVNFESL